MLIISDNYTEQDCKLLRSSSPILFSARNVFSEMTCRPIVSPKKNSPKRLSPNWFSPNRLHPEDRPVYRAAMGMGVPMGIPMGMGMVWVWGLW